MSDLSSLTERVGQALQDGTHLTWPEAALEEALRLALSEYNLALGGQATLQGLDGEAATSLPRQHESLLALGAAGYAAEGRAARRAEGDQPDARSAGELSGWAAQRLAAFREMLDRARGQELRAAGGAPWDDREGAGWKLDAWDGLP